MKDLPNYKVVQKFDEQLFYQPMSNSDYIYQNRLKERFEKELFNREARDKHLEEIRRKFKFEDLGR